MRFKREESALANGLEAMLEPRSVDLTIPLAEIYRYIDFDREEAEL